MDVDLEDWIISSSNTMDKILQFLQEQMFCIDEQKKQLSEIKDFILDQIKIYNCNSLRAQVGWPVPSPLDDLQPLCEKLVLVLSKQIQNLTEFSLSSPEWFNQYYKQMSDQLKIFLAAFIKRCLVIEKQPPQIVVKGNKHLNVSLRLLIGKKLMMSQVPSDVTCSLHLENEVSSFYEEKIESNVTCNAYSLIDTTPFKEKDGIFRVTYDKLKVPTAKKNTEPGGSRGSEKVLVQDQKTCFLFRTKVTFDDHLYLIEAISAPFVVVSKTDYEREAVEATVFWDNAFGVQNRRPFDIPEAVPLNQFLEALNYRWTKSNERELTPNQKNHLARKLFPVVNDDMSNYKVTKAMFHKDKLRDVAFTFWQWFFHILKFVNDFMKEEWRNGNIEGFIDRTNAEQCLNSKLVGSFLLRFSDSSLGGISVAYKNYLECESMEPWTREDLQKKTLSQFVREIPEFVSLYRGTELVPKESAFSLPVEERGKFPGYPVKKKMRAEIMGGSSSSTSELLVTTPDDFSMSTWDQVSSITGQSMPFSPLSLDDDPWLGLDQDNVQCSMDDMFNNSISS